MYSVSQSGVATEAYTSATDSDELSDTGTDRTTQPGHAEVTFSKGKTYKVARFKCAEEVMPLSSVSPPVIEGALHEKELRSGFTSIGTFFGRSTVAWEEMFVELDSLCNQESMDAECPSEGGHYHDTTFNNRSDYSLPDCSPEGTSFSRCLGATGDSMFQSEDEFSEAMNWESIVSPSSTELGRDFKTDSYACGRMEGVKTKSEISDVQDLPFHSIDSQKREVWLRKLSTARVSPVELNEAFSPFVKRIIDQLKNCEYKLHFVNTLKNPEESKNGEAVAKGEHRLIRSLKENFEENKLKIGVAYELSFKLGDCNNKVALYLKRVSPVTQETPQPRAGTDNIFDEAFKRANQTAIIFPLIQLSLDDFKEEAFFSSMIERIVELGQRYPNKDKVCDECVMKVMIRFRRDIPSDQVASGMDYRLVTSKPPEQLYISETLRLPSGGADAKPVYMDFKMLLMDEIPVNWCEIFDWRKEPLSNLEKLHWVLRDPDSINTDENREVVYSGTMPAIRNMNPATPKNNALAGKYRGTGIAQEVSDSAEFFSIVVKIFRAVLDDREVRIAKSTSILTVSVFTLFSKIAENCGVNFYFSPVDILTVLDPDAMMEVKKPCLSSSISDGDDCTRESGWRTPRRQYRESESEGIEKMVIVPMELLSVEDEMIDPVSYVRPEMTSLGFQAVGGGQLESSVSEHGNKYKMGSIQRKYGEYQKLEHITHDLNVPVATAIEGFLDVFCAMYFFKKVNQVWAVPSFENLIKVNFDGYPANFVIDGVNRLTLLDAVPATISINGKVVPGNQFLTKSWFPSREDFNRKLSTDIHMAFLFILVMLINPLRKLEEQYDFLLGVNVINKNLKLKIDRITHIVEIVSNWLIVDHDFMNWLGSCLMSFKSGRVSSADFESKNIREFYEEALKNFKLYVRSDKPTQNSDTDLNGLNNKEKIRLLRLWSDVVARYQTDIRSDESKLQEKTVERSEFISKGIVHNVLFKDGEIASIIGNMMSREAKHFFMDSEDKKNSFYEVLFKWLLHFKNDCGFLSFEEFKAELLTAGEMKGGKDLQSQGRLACLPAIQRTLSKMVLHENIDIVLVEPFMGDDKKVRVVKYQWRDGGCGECSIIDINETSGSQSLENIHGESSKTVILVNHQINKLYFMEDVSEFHWSAVCLDGFSSGETLNTKPVLKLYFPLMFHGDIDDDKKAGFKIIIAGLKKLYIKRAGLEKLQIIGKGSDDAQFLEKIMRWIPHDCGVWKSGGEGSGYAYIKIGLFSENTFFHFKPVLRAYSDLIRHDLGSSVQPTRIYVVLPFSEDGMCVRFKFCVSKVAQNQELSYMNFWGPILRSRLDIAISKGAVNPDKVDIIYLEGAEGFSTEQYRLSHVSKIIACRGYKKGFLENIIDDKSAVFKTDSESIGSNKKSSVDEGSVVSEDADEELPLDNIIPMMECFDYFHGHGDDHRSIDFEQWVEKGSPP